MKHSIESLSRRNSGVALIEVLVALLVLGVGLLGIAAMQSVSSQMTNGAEQRTQAVLLTMDMMDRIRANRPNRMDYDGVAVNPALQACNVNFVPAPNANVSVNDINEWSNLIVCLLPEGQARIVVNPVTRNVTITVDWQRQDAGGLPVTLQSLI